MPDIDIDFADRNKILSIIDHRIAALSNSKKHNTGIYELKYLVILLQMLLQLITKLQKIVDILN